MRNSGGIGVSNFLKRHLEELRRDVHHLKAEGSSHSRGLLRTWPPDVLQHEVHLLRREEELVRYCRLWNITVLKLGLHTLFIFMAFLFPGFSPLS